MDGQPSVKSRAFVAEAKPRFFTKWWEGFRLPTTV